MSSELAPKPSPSTPEEASQYRESLWRIGREIVIAAPQLFIDADVEADGIAGHGSLLSMGFVAPTGETFYRELKPSSDDFKPGNRKFCEEHGLQRDRLMVEGMDPKQAVSELFGWLQDLKQKTGKKPVFTAFNAGFDWALVDLAFVKADYQNNPFGIAPFDIKSLFMAINGEWDWSKTTKDNLPKIIVPSEEFTHNALEDSIWQQKLHFGAAALIGQTQYNAAIQQ